MGDQEVVMSAALALFRAGSRCGASSTLRASVCKVRAYHDNVIEHYENPRNVGSLDKNDKNVGTGLVGAPACGDVMKLQIKVNEETGEIEEAVFKTFGCGSAIASSSLATEWVQGKNVDDAVEVKNTEIAKHLNLPPVKLHCSMLAEDAIKAAIGDYKTKKPRKQQQHNEFPQIVPMYFILFYT